MDKNKNNSNVLIETLKDSGIFLLILLSSIIILAGISLLIGKGISKLHLIISIILSIVFFCIFNKKKRFFSILSAIALALIVFTLSIFINKAYLDLSWDGNTYHKDAVGLLKNEWNPIYENYIDAYNRIGNRNMDYIGTELQGTHGFWQTYYAKGTWFIASTVYAITNDIETGKCFNLLISYISFVLVLFILYKANSGIVFSALIAFFVSINPIIITQMFTYYNDGFLANLLILLIALMMIFNLDDSRINRTELYVCISCILLLIINTKFTGFGYAGIFCLFYYLMYIYNKYRQKQLKNVIKPTIIFVITTVFAVCIVGFSPYVTNLFQKHQLFYPLQGENKVDIVSYNQPKQFNNKSTIYKAAKSILSKASNINQKNKNNPQIKVPFTVSQEELDVLYHPDLRISGFGVLFSGILIISSLIFCVIIVNMIRKKEVGIILILTPIVVTAFLMLLISESWWARYTPYLYLIPLLTLVLITFQKSKVKQLLFIVLALPMFINMCYYFKYNTLANYETSKEINGYLENAKTEGKIAVIDTQDEFVGVLYNLEDKGIDFSVVTENRQDSKKLYKWIRYVKG